MFSKSIELLDRYTEAYAASGKYALNTHLLAEAKARLCQLNFLVEKVRDAEKRHSNYINQTRIQMGSPAGPPESFLEDFVGNLEDSTIEIRTHTEAFYYFSFRLLRIFQLAGEALPNLSKIECVPVRDIRNHLIEHPEGRSSRIFAQSIMYDCPEGPRLKLNRSEDESTDFRDEGLYKNAEALRLKIESCLNNALTKV